MGLQCLSAKQVHVRLRARPTAKISVSRCFQREYFGRFVKINRKIYINLRLNKIDALDFCSSLVSSLQLNFRKEMLKNIRCSYILYRKKFITLQFKALNSENDQKIGRKYNGNIAGNI